MLALWSPGVTRAANGFMKLASVFIMMTTVIFTNTVNAERNIMVDGDLNDWFLIERLHPAPWELPLYLPDYAAYATYDDVTSTYYFALKTDGTQTIGPDSTIWLDTDQSESTGSQLSEPFGNEFYVNFFSGDGKPYLYDENGDFVAGPLDHAFNPDNTTVEISVAGSHVNDVSSDIDIRIDITTDVGNSLFLPQYFSLSPYTVKTRDLPPRTSDMDQKRVAVVFSQESLDNHWGDYVYSQLYASMQHQVMMAGIPMDLIFVEDLKDLENLVKYDGLIFPYSPNVKEEDRSLIVSNLQAGAYHYGIGIITSSDWFTNDENNSPLSGDPGQMMKEILGVAWTGFEGGVDFNVTAFNVEHPVMSGYSVDEVMLEHNDAYYSTYAMPAGLSTIVTVLAQLQVEGAQGLTKNAILASETAGGSRNVHFGMPEFMGNGNLVWQALRWVVFGESSCPIGLQLGRQKSLFISRNDMDQSRFVDDFEIVTKALYDDFLVPWKMDYNFVGTYFINIGNDEKGGEYTDWTRSRPLYLDYIGLGNEIGSHGYTHPYHISDLTESELEFEFDLAQQIIKRELSLSELGTAQSGNPENLAVVSFLDRFLPYFSGTYTGVNIGFPGAFGFLSPDYNMTYFAPNMFADFYLVEFKGMSAAQATAVWKEQYQSILDHASTPIVHWYWHDYAPTIEPGYTAAMIEDIIELAYKDDAEFVTMMDLHKRISSLATSELSVSEIGGVVTAIVTSSDAGRFALDVGCNDSQVIEKVQNWYAYNSNKVFVPTNGGTFEIVLGASVDPTVTRITALPMRAELVSLQGDGTEMDFTFNGEGKVTVELNADEAVNLVAVGADSIAMIGITTLELMFTGEGMHSASIVVGTYNPTALPTLAPTPLPTLSPTRKNKKNKNPRL